MCNLSIESPGQWNGFCGTCGMDAVSALIIYLTCGSPVAMHYLYSGHKISLEIAFKTVLRFVFWPVFVVMLAISALRKSTQSGTLVSQQRARQLRDALETLAANHLNTAQKFELRYIFDRYVAFADAVSGDGFVNGMSEFLGVAAHTRPEIARACHDRRMIARLQRHFLDSRQELLDLLSGEVFRESEHADKFVETLSAFSADIELRDLYLNSQVFTREFGSDRLAA